MNRYLTLIILLLICSCTRGPSKSVADLALHAKDAAEKYDKRKKESEVKLVATQVYLAMKLSWTEWGAYPSKVKFVSSDAPEKDILQMPEQPKIDGN